ncbi:conjugal transfer protein TraG [Pseudoduganella ginsengisoli]|uniref:TraM recognition domain-containing protein n=1 Tax=Pseudoduganella ginsengisoli TaxID=1462440 RepID=A0A6L6Q8C2_9BURK|nr:type IV secretory system conjugative DNA transfer family protein [Pseudoduganella ginsengisoli]MTW05870.1 TraM recognition domain-containing protein [Pseudoduganella ginsengisoli]
MNDKYNNAVGPQIREGKAKRPKLIPALSVGSLVGSVWAATQYFAHKFEYQEALGTSFNHVYAPWSIVNWASKWNAQYPTEVTQAMSVGVMTGAASLLGLAVLNTVLSNSTKPNQYLHGSARWANFKDIVAAGLLPKPATALDKLMGRKERASDGVYVGAWVDKAGKTRYLRHNGPEHVLTYAPTRSGKGVGLVIPTLLSWRHSALITDLKGELYAMTAGWRQKYAGNKILRFEPASNDPGVAAWNPLDEIRLGTEYEVGDVQNTATLIVDPDGKGLKDHWQKTAMPLIAGVILHALYKRKLEGTPADMATVDFMMADPNRDIRELYMEMTQYSHVDGKNHPLIGSAGRDQLDRPDEEAGSVLSTAKSFLSLYRDPIVARNTSRSDFKIKDLMNHDSPVSLYIVTMPNDKARLRPLVRIMMNMIVRLLADKMEFERVQRERTAWERFWGKVVPATVRTKKTYKHRLLGMVDEFPSLGKLDILQESLAFVAGFGLKFYLICQDINQLKSREEGYGPDETISSNCHVQNAYPPNRVETAEHLSKLTGTTTVLKEAITVSGKRTAAMQGQVSKTMQETQRPLLTPDEAQRMPGPRKENELIVEAGDMVVYVAGYPAIYGKQPLFFKDPVFAARAAVPEPEVSDRLRTSAATEAVTI